MAASSSIIVPAAPLAPLASRGGDLGTSMHERIGNTPLVRLARATAHLPGITLLGKAEWANPGGSVKDRAASAIGAAAR